MRYEVVDPADRDDRGDFYSDLTDAMVNAGPRLEVWQLADDLGLTRMVRVWPDPEFEAVTSLEAERTKRFVREHIGRAEREATAILAQHEPVSPDRVHDLVALAWARGFVTGFGTGGETFNDLMRRIGGAS
jgi:hypothetical protein